MSRRSYAIRGQEKEDRIEIRCNEETKIGFKRVAADFDDYEHVIKWLVENYNDFRTLRVPARRKMMLKTGVL